MSTSEDRLQAILRRLSTLTRGLPAAQRAVCRRVSADVVALDAEWAQKVRAASHGTAGAECLLRGHGCGRAEGDAKGKGERNNCIGDRNAADGSSKRGVALVAHVTNLPVKRKMDEKCEVTSVGVKRRATHSISKKESEAELPSAHVRVPVVEVASMGEMNAPSVAPTPPVGRKIRPPVEKKAHRCISAPRSGASVVQCDTQHEKSDFTKGQRVSANIARPAEVSRIGQESVGHLVSCIGKQPSDLRVETPIRHDSTLSQQAVFLPSSFNGEDCVQNRVRCPNPRPDALVLPNGLQSVAAEAGPIAGQSSELSPLEKAGRGAKSPSNALKAFRNDMAQARAEAPNSQRGPAALLIQPAAANHVAGLPTLSDALLLQRKAQEKAKKEEARRLFGTEKKPCRQCRSDMRNRLVRLSRRDPDRSLAIWAERGECLFNNHADEPAPNLTANGQRPFLEMHAGAAPSFQSTPSESPSEEVAIA